MVRYALTYSEKNSDGKSFLVEQCKTHNTRNGVYIPTRLIDLVEKYDTIQEWIENSTCECEPSDTVANTKASIEKYATFFPLYIITLHNWTANMQEYIVDPSEHEHMERYLAGTDDPMYDFVHELRNNPRALPSSAELAEATERHNKRSKKNEEGSQ